MKCDFAVVGGGPAGCFAAAEAAKSGDVILFEEHRKQPVHCAGLISRYGFKKLGIKKGDFVLNEVKGAKLFSPLGSVIEVRARDTKAYAVDRSLFDGHLLDMAVSKGVSLENSNVDGIKDSTLNSRNRSFTAGKIIMATGTNYNLQKKLNLDYPKEFLFGAQYEMNVECEVDMVELHFVVPDFFAWIVPLDGRARVGLCTKTNPTPHLNSFIKKLEKEKRIRSSRIIDRSYGVIPIYDPNLRTQYKNLNLVGDAAGHVKATSGGGIVLGGIAAKYATKEDYETLWRKAIGRDLRLHLWIHRFVQKLSPKNLDYLFKITSENNNSLEKYGDMDYASKTTLGLFRNPNFTLKFLLNMPSFIIDLL